MALLDIQAMFSDAQAITATAVSTNHINTGNKMTAPRAPAATTGDLGGSGAIPVLVQVVEAFAGGTSLVAELQSSETADFAVAKTIASTPVMAVSDLPVGAKLPIPVVPVGTSQQYLRMNYVVVGTMTGGKITAGISAGNQTNG